MHKLTWAKIARVVLPIIFLGIAIPSFYFGVLYEITAQAIVDEENDPQKRFETSIGAIESTTQDDRASDAQWIRFKCSLCFIAGASSIILIAVSFQCAHEYVVKYEAVEEIGEQPTQEQPVAREPQQARRRHLEPEPEAREDYVINALGIPPVFPAPLSVAYRELQENEDYEDQGAPDPPGVPPTSS